MGRAGQRGHRQTKGLRRPLRNGPEVRFGVLPAAKLQQRPGKRQAGLHVVRTELELGHIEPSRPEVVPLQGGRPGQPHEGVRTQRKPLMRRFEQSLSLWQIAAFEMRIPERDEQHRFLRGRQMMILKEVHRLVSSAVLTQQFGQLNDSGGKGSGVGQHFPEQSDGLAPAAGPRQSLGQQGQQPRIAMPSRRLLQGRNRLIEAVLQQERVTKHDGSFSVGGIGFQDRRREFLGPVWTIGADRRIGELQRLLTGAGARLVRHGHDLGERWKLWRYDEIAPELSQTIGKESPTREGCATLGTCVVPLATGLRTPKLQTTVFFVKRNPAPARRREDDHGLAANDMASSGAAARIEGVGFLMADVTRLMRKGFDRRVKALGLTRPQWRVLVYVMQNEGLSQSALARAMDIERAPLGQLIRALESMRLVRRERSPADAREWQIFVGENARETLPQLLDAATWLRSVSLQGISRTDEQMLRRLLERMRSNLSYELER